MKRVFMFLLIMAFTAISTLSSENGSIHIFNSGDTISSSQMNSNFQLLAKQFKTNQKVINCPEDSIIDAIDEGYNHLIINGTCQTTFVISPFHLPWVELYGLEVTKPIVHLTLEGGTNGELAKTSEGFGMFVYGGALSIKNITFSQPIYASLSARVSIDNSSISKINSQHGSAIDINNAEINCDDSVSVCIYLTGSSNFRGEKLTVNSNSDTMFEAEFSSSAEIKESTFNDTSLNSDGGNTSIDIDRNSSVQFEDTTITMNDADVVVDLGGYLNLNGGEIRRNTGSPTVRVKAGIFEVYNGGTVSEITCESGLSYAPVDDVNGKTISPPSCKDLPSTSSSSNSFVQITTGNCISNGYKNLSSHECSQATNLMVDILRSETGVTGCKLEEGGNIVYNSKITSSTPAERDWVHKIFCKE